MQHFLDLHWKLLHDQPRLNAFAEALQGVVHSDSVVLDLGCGTGILGLLACRAGARRVYAVDATGILDGAKAIARQTPWADRIVHIRSHYATAAIPERVDIVVSDQCGPLGFEAGMVAMCEVAHDRFLRSDGRLMPARIDSWVAPASAPGVRPTVQRWSANVAGFDVSALRGYETGRVHNVSPGDVTLMAEGQRAVTLHPGVHRRHDTVIADIEFEINQSRVLDGLCGWFVAHLTDAVTVTNDLFDPGRIDRRAALFPIEPINVNVGDRVQVRFGIRPVANLVEWRGAVLRDGAVIGRFAGSTLPGATLFPPPAALFSD